jgi:hypothetical protein
VAREDSRGVVVRSDDRIAVGAAWRAELERAIERSGQGTDTLEGTTAG